MLPRHGISVSLKWAALVQGGGGYHSHKAGAEEVSRCHPPPPAWAPVWNAPRARELCSNLHLKRCARRIYSPSAAASYRGPVATGAGIAESHTVRAMSSRASVPPAGHSGRVAPYPVALLALPRLSYIARQARLSAVGQHRALLPSKGCTIHQLSDTCVADGAEGHWDSGNMPLCSCVQP